MYRLFQIRVLILLFLLLKPEIACSCEDLQDWTRFSTISFSSFNIPLNQKMNILWTRFTDGIYIAISEGIAKKEMYILENRLYLVKGLTEKELSSPASPFFMLDMNLYIVLRFLAQKFYQPCIIEYTLTPFAYTGRMDGRNFEVTGIAHRESTKKVVFDFNAVEKREYGANGNFSGWIEFSNITPIPKDTNISGWIAARSGLVISNNLLQLSGTINTIRDLLDFAPPNKKQ
jgi:hypothetical protein